ncbi:TIGR03557 family F420-dependent LLM class oxidoreductase [Dactylosporangium sp. CA-052675]|uniref:TIGR03557 family F420-dependent LLM class oxidoreductase n=1 Tax=Dactylosporangium sp. CA-052675 TaxID=3239927 RepID=UPI003D9259E4
MQIGYKLASEAFGPQELVRQAVRAEEAGFDFVEMSDHFHPWLEEQGHSPFTWTVLGAIAERTGSIGLATGVTCPTVRYHPAIIAQAAATLALLSGNRFTLGVGAGERLNEHVVGPGFGSVGLRHERLREALEIIRLLWSGGYHSYEGRHLQLDDARVFDQPDEPPPVAVACSGPASVRIAAQLGDGLFATEPDARLVGRYRELGGSGPRYAEAPMAWAEDEDQAVEAALGTSRWSLSGWKVMSELPNPVNFDAASSTVTADDIRRQFSVGPDTAAHVATVRRYADAGFDRIVLQNTGPDPDGFIDAYRDEMREELRTLQPEAA